MEFTKEELEDCLKELEISKLILADLFGVSYSAIYFWTKDPKKMKKSATYALRAWLTLKRNNLPWKPNMAA